LHLSFVWFLFSPFSQWSWPVCLFFFLNQAVLNRMNGSNFRILRRTAVKGIPTALVLLSLPCTSLMLTAVSGPCLLLLLAPVQTWTDNGPYKCSVLASNGTKQLKQPAGSKAIPFLRGCCPPRLCSRPSSTHRHSVVEMGSLPRYCTDSPLVL